MSVLGVIVFLAVGSILISLLITLIAYIGKVYMKKLFALYAYNIGEKCE